MKQKFRGPYKFFLNIVLNFCIDFQYMDGHKDQGINVREKAKQLVALLKDDERLRNERARALKAKERFAQSVSGFGSDGLDTMSPVSSDVSSPSLMQVCHRSNKQFLIYASLSCFSFKIGNLVTYLNRRLDVQVSTLYNASASIL